MELKKENREKEGEGVGRVCLNAKVIDLSHTA